MLINLILNFNYFSDLFEEKLKSKSISLAFPDYQGDDSFDSARDFIVEKYLSQSRVIYLLILIRSKKKSLVAPKKCY